MLNFGFGEILIVMVLALIFVGPERLPHMIRWLGRQYGKLTRASDELRRAFVLEADRMDAEQRTADLKRRRDEARQRAEEARRAREAGQEPPGDMPTMPDDAAPRPEPVPAATASQRPAGPAEPPDAPAQNAEPADAGDAAAAALAARGLDPAPVASPPPEPPGGEGQP